MPLSNTSAVNLLLDALVEQLEDKLITTQTDDATAGLVRAGELQDDPTDALINILVHPGGEDFRHELNTGYPGQQLAPYTIIGSYPGASWIRRFVVELSLFFDGDVVRELSREKAMVVLSRAHHAIMTMDLRPIARDSYGERANRVHVVDEYLSEGGGEGTFIWRGELRVEFFTDIEPE